MQEGKMAPDTFPDGACHGRLRGLKDKGKTSQLCTPPWCSLVDRSGRRRGEKKRWQRRRTFLGKQELGEQFQGQTKTCQRSKCHCLMLMVAMRTSGLSAPAWADTGPATGSYSLPIELENWLGKQFLINCQMYFFWVARAASPGIFTKQSLQQMLLGKRGRGSGVPAF